MPINHIAMIVDRSGSMHRIMPNVIKVFNNQLKTIKANAVKNDQKTFVTFYTFHSRVDKPLYSKRPAAQVRPIKNIRTAGSTALFDAVGTAMVELDKTRDVKLDNTSCLVIVLTDGAENTSRIYRRKLPGMIKKAQKTGRWSFAFLTPKSGVKALVKFGIPAGNIQDWAATAQGAKHIDIKLRHGLDHFFEARRSGKKQVAGFFRADLTKVNAKDVAGRLRDVSRDFKRLSVDVGKAAIRTFVDGKLGAGTYKPGSGYYELTKPELVQAQKEIAIRDNKSGAVFAGAGARSMLGFPEGAAFKVKPGAMGDYSVFIMSTSLNRVLAKGTTLLYRA
jgi:hypothetical protein